MRSLIALIPLYTAVAGCSLPSFLVDSEDDNIEQKSYTHISPSPVVLSDLSVAISPRGRAGAAFRQRSYVHALVPLRDITEIPVLVTNEPGSRSPGSMANSEIQEARTMVAVKDFNALHARPSLNNLESTSKPNTKMVATSPIKQTSEPSSGKRGYSVYELSRWERYCNGGKGMDIADWRFVATQGTQNIPTDVLQDCSPPSNP